MKIRSLAVAAFVCGLAVAAPALPAQASGGGGCQTSSADKTEVRSCISAHNRVVLPDFYVHKNGHCKSLGWGIYQNTKRVRFGYTSCSRGYHTLPEFKGGGTWQLVVYKSGGLVAPSPRLFN